LEERRLLTPVLPIGTPTVTFTQAATPTNSDLGTVSLTRSTTPTTSSTAAPTTSVSLLTPAASFGGDIVRIQAGPGGVFGSGVYAISRGAGGNTGAVNRPGVIYRVDPVTGKATVFFDLNTVINQLETGGTAANSVGNSTGLVNWYDITFDPEGYFDGKPSMFVASVDRSDPNKNVIYQISPSGQFLGAFVQFTNGQSALKFTVNPSSVLIPPPQDQNFLRGLLAGGGVSSTGGEFSALFFNSNEYQPGQNISSSTLPAGVQETDMSSGPQVGLTAANPDYISRVYGAYTDFGTPAAGGVPAEPGESGVQGLNGEQLIAPQTTEFRRFEDIAFDQYGYFSQGYTLTSATGGTTGGSSTSIQGNTVGGLALGNQNYAGSLFVADLASGFTVSVTPAAPLATVAVNIPVQGPGTVGVTTDSSGAVVPIITNGNTTGGSNFGGRILRITPSGTVSVFASGFDTSGAQTSSSFINSSLSISFSADGTVLYASDNDGIWQFKTVQDLADSQSGQLIGLNDLRTLGVPYDGLGSAVAIVDTGVDGLSTPFRGRVALGTDVVTNGFGNQDFAPAGTSTTTGGTTGGGTTGTGTNTVTPLSGDGHGTLVAGVVAQFVPQATIEPVDVFSPFLVTTAITSTGTTGGGTTTGSGSSTQATNATTSSQEIYQGLDYITKHPFVNDPIRPGKVDRVIESVIGFGTTTTYVTEGTAYQQIPQIVIAFKNKLLQFRKLGIAPIAAAGQFGAPQLAGVSSTTGSTTGGGTTTGTGSSAGAGDNNSLNASVGDDNGMSFPAVLNDVISVTGSIPFPFQEGPSSPPTDPVIGVVPRPAGPILIYSYGNPGGAPSTSTGGNTGGTTTTPTGNVIQVLANGNFVFYTNRILASANRGPTTDFAAPAIDVPTFRETQGSTSPTVVAGGTTGGTASTSAHVAPASKNVFQEGGTSLSAGIVGGAYALVSSALNYWSQLNGAAKGFTSDAYLTQPVGVNTLNFGPHAFRNLAGFNNPNGINAILAWTSVPITDANDSLAASTPHFITGTTNFPQYAALNIANAVAAIEGTEAINYLLRHNVFPVIDTNHDGLITAQEIQNFTDNSASMGMPEAGAMARLLGGTGRTPGPDVTTAAGEQPDQPDALQRRFNFFNYAASGSLTGGISINQFRMLAHILLPSPDAFAITNRQRASANNFLVAPKSHRNFQELQHLSLSSALAPLSQVRKFRKLSPNQLGVNTGFNQAPGEAGPFYTLFGGDPKSITNAKSPKSTTGGSTTTSTTGGSSTSTSTTQTTSQSSNSAPETTTTGSTGSSSTTGTGSGTGSGSGSASGSSSASPQQQVINAAAALTNNMGSGSASSSSSSSGSGTSSDVGSGTLGVNTPATTPNTTTPSTNMPTVTDPTVATTSTPPSSSSDPNKTKQTS
jgi:hypothetical protein